jgi:catechol 2,3-dioxygenase-like lactoylglutathione lyase family enzyme
MRIEKISAVTLTVASMRNSVRFYGDVLGTGTEERTEEFPKCARSVQRVSQTVVLSLRQIAVISGVARNHQL